MPSLKLRGQEISGETVSCTGPQVEAVLQACEQCIGVVCWYASDIEVTGNRAIETCDLVRLGSATSILPQLRLIDQFLKGVFIAIHQAESYPRLRSDIRTDDSSDCDIGSAMLEIRMFDTTYIEVVSIHQSILDCIKDRFV